MDLEALAVDLYALRRAMDFVAKPPFGIGPSDINDVIPSFSRRLETTPRFRASALVWHPSTIGEIIILQQRG